MRQCDTEALNALSTALLKSQYERACSLLFVIWQPFFRWNAALKPESRGFPRLKKIEDALQESGLLEFALNAWASIEGGRESAFTEGDLARAFDLTDEFWRIFLGEAENEAGFDAPDPQPLDYTPGDSASLARLCRDFGDRVGDPASVHAWRRDKYVGLVGATLEAASGSIQIYLRGGTPEFADEVEAALSRAEIRAPVQRAWTVCHRPSAAPVSREELHELFLLSRVLHAEFVDIDQRALAAYQEKSKPAQGS